MPIIIVVVFQARIHAYINNVHSRLIKFDCTRNALVHAISIYESRIELCRAYNLNCQQGKLSS